MVTYNRSIGRIVSERALAAALMRAMTPAAAEIAIRREGYRTQVSMADAIASAARSGTRGLTNRVTAFAEGMRRNFARPQDLQKIHSDVAASMRDAVRRSFDASGQTSVGRYREMETKITKGGFLSRYSGGALRRAITDPNLAVGTAQGISFVDEGRLTREAAHWARLNFGARGTAIGDRAKRRYRLIFDKRVITTVGFNVGSRPAFALPPGRWFTTEDKRVAASHTRRGMDRFFPGSRFGRTNVEVMNPDGRTTTIRKRLTGLKGRPTRGIQGREFLDAGLRRMAEELPRRYEDLLDGWYANARRRAALPKQVQVKPEWTGRTKTFSLSYVSER